MPSAIEAEIIAALGGAIPELDGRISAGMRPEGSPLPWVTYETSMERHDGSQSVAVRAVMELAIIAETHAYAREMADLIAFRARAVALANGERITVGDGDTAAPAADDGSGDGERTVTITLSAWYFHE